MDSDVIACPDCGCRRVWKDGKCYTKYGVIQRYMCSECARSFS